MLMVQSRLLTTLAAEGGTSVQYSQLAEKVQPSLASASPHLPGSKIDLTFTEFARPVYKSQTYVHCCTMKWHCLD